MLIIDCHCHAGKGDGLQGPWDTNAPLKKFLQWSEEAGIKRTNLFSAFHSDYSLANAKVAEVVKRNPEKFYGFAFINPIRDQGRVFEMVKISVQDFGFKGIKVHKHDARISREICEVARNFSVPVLYDVMGEVHVIELLATEYPDVNFIIPHLSSFADDWKAQIAFVDHLARHPNIYTDTSGVRRFDVLEMALNRAGADKILFGTDGPWLHPAVELAKIYALKLSRRELHDVLAGNFLKLIANVRYRPKRIPTEYVKRNLEENRNFADPWLLPDIQL
ncbi:MAG: amidohydrolase family protein [Sporocytophaga sp.]|uniref:amidohydrolase family protein n=1 Tax=Sporocytophaga sp. TaxID=2231183 RepID=UPI001B113FE6|nr:amidohydrolase family protein [Sporocytophaga sp.]MBO9702382.1 amidohydrolase family protein [Sporocytophaga sp.]